MYSTIVSVPSCSPTWAQYVLTEFVSASVMLHDRPEVLPAGVRERTPEIPESAFSVVEGSNSPESSAAVAVTTFIVEPGG